MRIAKMATIYKRTVMIKSTLIEHIYGLHEKRQMGR